MKTSMRLSFSIVCILVLAGELLISCQVVGPPAVPTPAHKDPRNYTWTIDTLAYPGSYQTFMRSFWGSSSSNLYAVGHNDQNKGMMYHYDGKRWLEVPLTWSEGGPIREAVDLVSVWGVSANDIWAVGESAFMNPTPPPNFLDSSLVIHFDGSQWSEVPLNRGRGLWAIKGLDKTNVWAGGSSGALYHFDGASWARQQFPSPFQDDVEWLFAAFDVKQNGSVYAFLNGHENSTATDYYKFALRSGSDWQIIDSFQIGPGHLTSKWGASKFWTSPSGEMYSAGDAIWRWDGVQWQKEVSTTVILADIFGTRSDHIFSVGVMGTVYFFDGHLWNQLGVPGDPTWLLMAVWCTDDEVFITGYDGYRTYVLHGK